MRISVITIAAFALALFALCEIGLAYPVAWWLYLSVGIAFAAGLIRPVAFRVQVAQIWVLLAIVAFIVLLFLVPWTTRKPFLHDLARIRIGMTETEVRRIMRRYKEGTGWPSPPFSNPSDSPGTLTIAGSASQYSTQTSPSGQMVIRDSLVFRHSNRPAFNSDWGIVSLSSGRVVSVEFSPD